MRWLPKWKYYHDELKAYVGFIIPPKSSVLEMGCGAGNLVGSLDSSHAVGIDINHEKLDLARKNYSHVEFKLGSFENLTLKEKFDYVLVRGLGRSNDIIKVLQNLHQVCRPDTKIIILQFNYLWEPLLKIGELIGIRRSRPIHHWLSAMDIKNMLYLADFNTVKIQPHFIFPVYIPFVSAFINKFIGNLPLINRLSINQFVIASQDVKRKNPDNVTCSVIIPCRNEEGNVENAVRRIPHLGRDTEIIFVEGHSKDKTYEECMRVKDMYLDRKITVIHQSGLGKANAVRDGFDVAKGDILVILDADLTVAPEDLPKFVAVLVDGKGELINGCRLVYQMDDFAMRRLNLLGNKFFSWLFSYLLNQTIKDTLCGTKVLWREDYEKIKANRSYFGDFDPFGDFDLLFGAAKLNLRIIDLPVKYYERSYGTTQINRFRHGWLLLKMSYFALRKMKIR